MSSIVTTQPDLFPPGELPEGAELLIPIDQQRDLYPLSTVERNQERMQSILFLLGRNAPKQFICDSMKIGWYTLQSIAEKHGEKIADIKRKSAGKAALFVELGLDQMLEDLQAGRLSADKLAFALKMVVDIMQLLTGEATSIIGNTSDKPRLTAETLREKLATMQRVEVIDVPSTGSGGGKDSPMSAEAPVSPAQVDNGSIK